MKNYFKKLTRGASTWLFVLATAISCTSYAQVTRITGKVTSADDSQPLPGVNVKIKGTNTFAPTDVNGNYTIPAKVGDILVFSFVGFQTKEVVAKNSILNVTIAAASSSLNEVVVIGYGTAKRKDLTGSISSISAKDISKTVSTTFDQALQGRVAGVVVQQNSGQPGGGVSIVVRGLSTLNSGKDPLYVIDGVIIPPNLPSSTNATYIGNSPTNNNPLNTINPNDIASIDVLKDASAIAIYGSQGSNGVVVVTTKRGIIGAPKINFDAYFGNQQIIKRLPLMDLQQYATFLDTKASIGGYAPQPQFVNPKYLGQGTNWQNEIFKTAGEYNGSLTISGGDTRTQYLLSGNYFSQDGVAIGSSFKRANVKLNLDNKPTNWIKVGTSLTVSSINENINNSNYNLINSALGLTPDIPVSNPDGSISYPPGYVGSYNPNPVAAAALNTNMIKRSQLFGNGYAEIYFTKDLTLRNELSENIDFGNINQFFPSLGINGTASISSASVTATNNKSHTLRNYLTYNHTVLTSLNINVLAGHESSGGVYTYLSGARTGFLANNPQGLSLGNSTTATNSGGTSDYANESYFGRVNLGYDSKYLLTGSVRDDGNSNFAPGNRWVVTYSVAGAYDIAKEKFLKDAALFDQLKLRLGYGLTNNANIGGYRYGAPVSLGTVGLGLGSYVTQIANPNVKWETTTGYNLGVDLGILKNRIQFTADAYTRKTNNLLLTLPLPRYAATDGTGQLGAPVYNVGSIQNKGFEFTLNTRNIQGKNFNWSTTATFSLNRNKILTLNTDNAFFIGTIDNGSITATRTSVGRSIGEFYGYITNGVFKDAADLKNSPSQGTVSRQNGIWVGDIKYKDLNGDGKIDQSDQTYLGSPTPKFQYGFNNTFSYKGFDLTLFFNGNYGNKILNYLRKYHEDPNGGNTGFYETLYNYANIGLKNPTGTYDDVNNVYVTNPNTSVPAFRQSGDPNSNGRISTRFIEDGSYLRLKNLNFGYSLPSRWLTKIHASNVRIYTSIQNVFTITKYTGYDPEIGTYYDAFTQGIDFGRYPSPRIYTLGFNVGF